MTIFTALLKAAHIPITERIRAVDLNAIEVAINELAAAVAPLLSTTGPSTPVTLSATPGVGVVALSWTPVSGGSSVTVQRSGVDAFGNAGTVVTLPTTATLYKFENLIPGTPYTFTFQVLPGGTTQTVTATPLAPSTQTAQTVVTTEVGDGKVTVRWTAPSGTPTGYLVGRDGADAVNGGTGWETTDPATATSREFLSLINGTTYNFYVEPQPSTSTGGSYVRVSKSATPVAAAVPAGQTTVTLSAITNSTITMNWTPVAGATGYTVGRVNLSNPADVYETTDPAGTTSRVFDQLTSGVPYSCYVTPVPGGTKVAKTGTPTGTVVVVTPPPTGSGTGWLSGWSGNMVGENPGALATLGTWRGEPTTYYRTWTEGANPYMDPYSSWSGGTLDVAFGGPGGPLGGSWATGASGGMDSVLTQVCRNLHAKWGSLKCMHLSFAHELNGGWYAWTTVGQNPAYVRQTFQRFYNIVQQELVAKGRNAKVVINYASGQNGVESIWPGNAYVDIVGLDMYDMYMPTHLPYFQGLGNIRDDTDWNNFVNSTTGDGSPFGWNKWRDYAASKGKPFVVPEWALSAAAEFEYDNPFWIQKTRDFFASCAPVDKDNPGPGKIAGEGYFNVGADYGTRCELYPNTAAKPQSSAKYKSLSWGIV